MCQKCGQSSCGCTKIISKQGPKGKDGLPGKNGKDGGGLIVAMKSSTTGDFPLATNGWGATTAQFTSDLSHTITSGVGLYKIEFVLMVSVELPYSGLLAGLNVNGVPPSGTANNFEISEFILGALNTQPVYGFMYKNLSNGDVVYPDFNYTGPTFPGFLQYSRTQMVITKVNSSL